MFPHNVARTVLLPGNLTFCSLISNLDALEKPVTFLSDSASSSTCRVGVSQKRQLFQSEMDISLLLFWGVFCLFFVYCPFLYSYKCSGPRANSADGDIGTYLFYS